MASPYGILKGEKIIREVAAAVAEWSKYARLAGVDEKKAKAIKETHRLLLSHTSL